MGNIWLGALTLLQIYFFKEILLFLSFDKKQPRSCL